MRRCLAGLGASSPDLGRKLALHVCGLAVQDLCRSSKGKNKNLAQKMKQIEAMPPGRERSRGGRRANLVGFKDLFELGIGLPSCCSRRLRDVAPRSRSPSPPPSHAVAVVDVAAPLLARCRRHCLPRTRAPSSMQWRRSSLTVPTTSTARGHHGRCSGEISRTWSSSSARRRCLLLAADVTDSLARGRRHLHRGATKVNITDRVGFGSAVNWLTGVTGRLAG
ncbi:hypothetical protein PR202_gb07922 [Eleusine coracana subsp. coracana]|uniref:Uncharacterized protein n=1 Tax=Eleusine coracana subsp. coracana TaxID=191504 RepID=A0AAV5EDC3_ELECO|nr:hypothetical protein PR202_gb07922 [Eleusine coracana subsp. coracana]